MPPRPNPESEPRGWYSRGYLPHFDDGRSLQAITYRLAEALPADVVAKLKEQSPDPTAIGDDIAHFLDAGHGCCCLREPVHARCIVENWHHFAGQRYYLHAWVVMPNHVHVLIEPLHGASLAAIVQSWKSYTAKQILAHSPALAKALRGTLWQPDYRDRYIRDEAHYRRSVDYIHRNPVKAGLVSSPDLWSWSSTKREYRGSAGGPPAS